MSHTPARPPIARCLLVLLVVTAGAAGLSLLLLPDVLALGRAIRGGALAGHPFDQVLIQFCEVALVGCAAWLWLTTAFVAGGAACGSRPRHVGMPQVLGRWVLAACGVALVGGLSTPAHAGDGAGTSPLDGLPLPERATATTQVSRVFARAEARHTADHPMRRPTPVVLVRPGDTLWALARAGLPRPEDDDVAARVREIHQANLAVIGPDPDLIRPGQRLRMPRPSTMREEHR